MTTPSPRAGRAPGEKVVYWNLGLTRLSALSWNVCFVPLMPVARWSTVIWATRRTKWATDEHFGQLNDIKQKRTAFMCKCFVAIGLPAYAKFYETAACCDIGMMPFCLRRSLD